MLTLWNRAVKTAQPAWTTTRGNENNLAGVASGRKVSIQKFDDRMPASQRELLQAYGLNPGREISVIQQKPVTVVQVDFTELAFETQVARQVIVKDEG